MSDQKHHSDDQQLDALFREAYSSSEDPHPNDWAAFEAKWANHTETDRKPRFGWWVFGSAMLLVGIGIAVYWYVAGSEVPLSNERMRPEKGNSAVHSVPTNEPKQESGVKTKPVFSESSVTDHPKKGEPLPLPKESVESTKLSAQPQETDQGVNEDISTKRDDSEGEGVNMTDSTREKESPISQDTKVKEQHHEDEHVYSSEVVNETRINYVVEQDTVVEVDSVTVSKKELKRLKRQGKL